MRVIYVAGKFRGPDSWAIEQNIRAAETLALAVWQMGAAAICPHTNTRFYQGAAPDHVWLDGDLAILRKCDALLTVDNWRDSIGATAEVEHARVCHIPVFHTLQDLHAWLEGPCLNCGRPSVSVLCKTCRDVPASSIV